jgi:hypothetical protein
MVPAAVVASPKCVSSHLLLGVRDSDFKVKAVIDRVWGFAQKPLCLLETGSFPYLLPCPDSNTPRFSPQRNCPLGRFLS